MVPEALHCGLSPQEDSEDGEVGRRPSVELVSEAEPATEDGERQVCVGIQRTRGQGLYAAFKCTLLMHFCILQTDSFHHCTLK